MGDRVPSAVASPRNSHPGRAGRLPSLVSSSRALVVARLQGQRDLRLALRRLGKYLADPSTPIDDVFLRALSQLADRCGLPRVTAQSVESSTMATTFSVSVGDVGERVRARLERVERFLDAREVTVDG